MVDSFGHGAGMKEGSWALAIPSRGRAPQGSVRQAVGRVSPAVTPSLWRRVLMEPFGHGVRTDGANWVLANRVKLTPLCVFDLIRTGLRLILEVAMFWRYATIPHSGLGDQTSSANWASATPMALSVKALCRWEWISTGPLLPAAMVIASRCVMTAHSGFGAPTVQDS
jgi:hypothetical protein